MKGISNVKRKGADTLEKAGGKKAKASKLQLSSVVHRGVKEVRRVRGNKSNKHSVDSSAQARTSEETSRRTKIGFKRSKKQEAKIDSHLKTQKYDPKDQIELEKDWNFGDAIKGVFHPSYKEIKLEQAGVDYRRIWIALADATVLLSGVYMTFVSKNIGANIMGLIVIARMVDQRGRGALKAIQEEYRGVK